MHLWQQHDRSQSICLSLQHHGQRQSIRLSLQHHGQRQSIRLSIQHHGQRQSICLSLQHHGQRQLTRRQTCNPNILVQHHGRHQTARPCIQHHWQEVSDTAVISAPRTVSSVIYGRPFSATCLPPYSWHYSRQLLTSIGDYDRSWHSLHFLSRGSSLGNMKKNNKKKHLTWSMHLRHWY